MAMVRNNATVSSTYMAYPGKLMLVVGAAGSGKGVLIRRATELHPEIVFPVSATTRAVRPQEVDGTHYHFITKEEFQSRIEEGQFIEWATTDGNFYGTPRSEIVPPLEAGSLILEEMDVKGVRQILDLIPRENIATVYIDAGGWETLAQRIQERAPISPEELDSRRQRFEYERKFREEADFVVENFDGKFTEADAAFEAIIQSLLPSAR